tara:strand:- start:184 stop:432 length:249 start_codon:yes stop_codon:yes gene_type:complete
MLTSRPQTTDAATAVKLAEMLQRKKKQIDVASASVITGCLSIRLRIQSGKCLYENIILTQVRIPRIAPSIMIGSFVVVVNKL